MRANYKRPVPSGIDHGQRGKASQFHLQLHPTFGTREKLGFVAGTLLEWFARVLNLWSYSALMPTITVASVAVGLAPVIQITILPAASLCLAVIFSKATGTDPA